jgi:hypothetical protein
MPKRYHLSAEDIATLLDAAAEREREVPIDLTLVLRVLSAKYPFRMRAIRKDLAWIEREAKKLGVML